MISAAEDWHQHGLVLLQLRTYYSHLLKQKPHLCVCVDMTMILNCSYNRLWPRSEKVLPPSIFPCCYGNTLKYDDVDDGQHGI